jgi:hypothetical protein
MKLRKIFVILPLLLFLSTAYADDITVTVNVIQPNVTQPIRPTTMIALARYSIIAYIAFVLLLIPIFTEFLLRRFYEIKGLESAIVQMIVLILGILLIVSLFTL